MTTTTDHLHSSAAAKTAHQRTLPHQEGSADSFREASNLVPRSCYSNRTLRLLRYTSSGREGVLLKMGRFAFY